MFHIFPHKKTKSSYFYIPAAQCGDKSDEFKARHLKFFFALIEIYVSQLYLHSKNKVRCTYFKMGSGMLLFDRSKRKSTNEQLSIILQLLIQK